MSSNGFLPYFISNNKIYFLLGKEENNLYSDFSGSKIGQESDLNNAIREFHEETMDIFKDIINLNNNIKFTNNNHNCFLIKFNNMHTERIITYNAIINRLHAYKANNDLLEKRMLQWFDSTYIINNKHQFRQSFYDTFIKIAHLRD